MTVERMDIKDVLQSLSVVTHKSLCLTHMSLNKGRALLEMEVIFFRNATTQNLEDRPKLVPVMCLAFLHLTLLH